MNLKGIIFVTAAYVGISAWSNGKKSVFGTSQEREDFVKAKRGEGKAKYQ